MKLEIKTPLVKHYYVLNKPFEIHILTSEELRISCEGRIIEIKIDYLCFINNVLTVSILRSKKKWLEAEEKILQTKFFKKVVEKNENDV